MKTDRKPFYEAPQTWVFEMKTEGMICASGETEAFTVGSTYGESLFN